MNTSFRNRALILFAALSLLTATAQAKFLEKPERVRPFEAEIFYGLGTGFKYHDTYADGGGTIGLELRGNIKGTAWDVGGFLRFDATGYDFKNHMPPIEPEPDGYVYYLDPDQSAQAFTIGASAHYNFRQGRKVNPFAGLGIGYSVYSSGGHDFLHPYPTDGCTISFIPRFGVELFSWVRFTGYAFILRKGYNTIGLSLGLTIGGWRRKNR